MQKQVPSKYVAAMLGVFLGVLGLHKFYVREHGTAVVMLLASLLLSWTVVVPLIIAIVGFLQGASYLFWSDEEWAKRFNS